MIAIHRRARILLATGALLSSIAGTPAARADSLEWSITATGTSDYIFRGISLNNEDPTLQGSFDLTYGMWYAGVWGSGVDGAGYEPVEVDLYAGVKPEVGPVTFDFGFVYYAYPFNHDDGEESEYIEFKAGAEYAPVKNLTLTPVFWYVPDQDNSDAVYTIEGTVAYEFPAVGIFTPTVSGLVGYTSADSDGTFFEDVTDDYTYWNAGLSLAVEKFTFDFRYWDTDIDDSGLADERFVFTAAISLP